MDTHTERIIKLFTDIREERRTGRYILVVDAFRGGVAGLEIGKGERVPQGASVLMAKTGSFVVIPEEDS